MHNQGASVGLMSRLSLSINHSNCGASVPAKGLFQRLGLSVPPTHLVLQSIEGHRDKLDVIIHGSLPGLGR
jgi:hypothetical protein